MLFPTNIIAKELKNILLNDDFKVRYEAYSELKNTNLPVIPCVTTKNFVRISNLEKIHRYATNYPKLFNFFYKFCQNSIWVQSISF